MNKLQFVENLAKVYHLNEEDLMKMTMKELKALEAEEMAKAQAAKEAEAQTETQPEENAVATVEGDGAADAAGTEEQPATTEAQVAAENAKAAEADEAFVVTDEMLAPFKDEHSELYCGTFQSPDLTSPICSSECQEMFPDRFATCIALAARAEQQRTVVKKASSRGGRGKSEMKEYIISLIGEGKYTRKQIADMFCAKFPSGARSTATTYLSDGASKKYCPFDHYIVYDPQTKVASWGEKAPGSRAKSEALYG